MWLPVWKSKFYGALVLNHRVVLRNPMQRLISTQVAALAARFEKDRRHKACVDLLLRHGASIDVADGRGRLLRDLPTSNNVKRVLKRSTTLPVAEKENATGQVKRASSAPISLRA